MLVSPEGLIKLEVDVSKRNKTVKFRFKCEWEEGKKSKKEKKNLVIKTVKEKKPKK